MTAVEPTTCVCGGCGLVPVDEDYVSRQAAKRVDPGTGVVPPGLLAALRDSVRPCHECRADQYERWRSGDYGTASAPRRGARRAYRGKGGS